MDGSIHRTSWPSAAEFGDAPSGADAALPSLAGHVLHEVRRAKTEAKTGMRTAVRHLAVTATGDDAARLDQVRGDLVDAGVVEELVITVDDDATEVLVTAELVPPEG